MSDTTIIAGLLAASCLALWWSGMILLEQSRTLSQIHASLGSIIAMLGEIRDPVGHVRQMLMDGSYNGPKSPAKTVDFDLFLKTVLARHELDRLGQRSTASTKQVQEPSSE